MRGDGFNVRAVPVAALVFFMASSVLYTQNLPDRIIRLVESEYAEQDEAEAVMEYLEDLSMSPLALNSATREELEANPLLNPFMVLSLLEYREEYGPVVSFAELALIDGFGEEKTELLRAFVTLSVAEGPDARRDRASARVLVKNRFDLRRERQEYDGSPLYSYFRYKVGYGGMVSFGFTMEKDAGEPAFPDFLSLYIHLKDIRIGKGVVLKDAVAGDFTVRAGQGLVLWNSFSLSGLSSPSQAIRRPVPVSPYTSSSEDGFFRGVAATISFRELLSATLFYSNNGRDARVGDGCFYSLPSGGLHADSSSIANKDALREEVIGAVLACVFPSFRVGLTGAAYRYGLKDGRRDAVYNRYLKYDGWQGNVSADILFSYRGLRAFAEVALDMGPAIGAVAGAGYVSANGFEVSALLRYYDKKFISTYAGAFKASARCNNEAGAAVAMLWNCTSGVTVSADADYAWHPWPLYGTDGPTSSIKVTARCDWEIAEGHLMDFRGRYTGRPEQGKDAFSLRAGYSYSGQVFSFDARTICSYSGKAGVLLHAGWGYGSPSGKLVFSSGYTVFRAEEWDARIYSYERDLPYSFSVPVYYGTGVSAYAIVQYRPFRWLSCGFKWSGTKYKEREKDNMRFRLQVSLSF